MTNHKHPKTTGTTAALRARRGRKTRLGTASALLATAAVALGGGIVVATTSASDAVISSFGSAGSAGGQFSTSTFSPAGVAVNTTGNGGAAAGDVYVADRNNNRVEQFSSSGAFLRAWGIGVVASGPDLGEAPADAVQELKVSATGGTFAVSLEGQSTGGTGTGTLTSGSKTVGGLITAQGTGTITSGSPIITAVSTSSGRFVVGQPIAGTGIPSGASIVAVSGSTITLSEAATAGGSGVALSSDGPLPFAVGQTIAGQGIPAGTTIAAVAAGSLTLSAAASESGTGVALSSGLAYDVSAANLQTALQGLGSIGSGAVAVTGGPGSETGSTPYKLTFEGNLANMPVPTLQASGAGLTGGSPSSTATATTTTAGQTGFAVCSAEAGDTCKAGGAGFGPGGMDGPAGVAVEQATGNVYVAQATDKRIDVFSATGVFEGAFGWGVADGAPTLELCTTFCRKAALASTVPAGDLGGNSTLGYGALAFNSGGDLYIQDAPAARIDEFSPTISAGKIAGIAFVRSFGWGVLNGAAELQSCTPATGCQTGLSGSGVGQLYTTIGSVSGLGVDSEGNVYLDEVPSSASCSTTTPCRVEKFTATGSGAETFAAGELESTSGETTRIGTLTVDPEPEGHIYVAQADESETKAVIREFNASGELLQTDAASGPSLPKAERMNGSALGTGGSLYIDSGNEHKVYQLNTPPAPSVGILPVTEVGNGTATFNGTVNPNGYYTTYFFEYSTNGVTWKRYPATPAQAGEGSGSVEEHQSISGLQANTAYHVRLTASTGTAATSSEATFETGKSAPAVSSVLAAPVRQTSATLTGYVNPENSPTTYYYQYGTTTSYGSVAPGSFAPYIGSGGEPLPVPVEVTGLTPGTTYHFRLVATSPSGTTYSTDHAFTTVAAAGTCANERLRGESAVDPATGKPYSEQLPECRAYELVSPQAKNGNNIAAYYSSGVGGTKVTAVAAGGDQLVDHVAYSSFPGEVGHTDTTAVYLFKRGAAEWEYENLNAPVAAIAYSSPHGGEGIAKPEPEVNGFEDLAEGIWEGRLATWPAARSDLFLREPDGHFTDIGPVGSPAAMATEAPAPNPSDEPPATLKADLTAVDASQNLHVIAFDLATEVEHPAYFWPGDRTTTSENAVPSLYEYVGAGHSGDGSDAPALVGVNNEGSQISDCGTGLGENTKAFSERHAAASDGKPQGAVSAGGSTVFFTAGAAGCKGGSVGTASQQVFARIGQPGGEQATVNVAATHDGGADDVQQLTVTATGGSFELNHGGIPFKGFVIGGESTTALPYDATAAEVTSALEALPAIGSGNVEVSEPTAGEYVMKFVGSLAGVKVSQLAVATSALTGGSASVAVVTEGEPGCAVSNSCAVTEEITDQAAAANGSRVFFTRGPNGQQALEECRLPGDGGAVPSKAGAVDACPKLVQIAPASAELQSVVSVSEKGDYVYFIAKASLSATPNGQGRVAEAGKDNLYVYDTATEATSFIATVPTATLAEAQTNPGGEYLVFTSAGQLTLEDTSTVAQVFRYDAGNHELLRLSYGQDGYNNDGNTEADAASLAPFNTLSNDGEYVVFQSADALTPAVQAGSENNVYLWHDGNVSLISDGAGGYAAVGGIPSTGLTGVDASGRNIFFTTAAALVGQDTNEVADMYDARIEGGFEAPASPPGCEGEGCKGPFTGSLPALTVGSAHAPAVGNLTPPKAPEEVEAPAKKTTGRVKIVKHAIKGMTVVLVVKAPGKGRLEARGKGLKATAKTVKGKARYRLMLKLTKTEQKQLKRERRRLRHEKGKHRRSGALTLRVKVIFRPSAGKTSHAIAKFRIEV